MFFDLPGISPPQQVSMYALWGSSAQDVWAAGHSDIPSGRLWHFDGTRWTPARGWPKSGFDGSNSYIVYPFAVTGFDSTNVFVACDRYYSGSDSAMVLKWNGSAWIDLPFKEGRRSNGGLGWIVAQNGVRAWAAGSGGSVVKYENGYLSTEPYFTNYRLGQYQIASLTNGDVFVNAFKDSMTKGIPIGEISKLYRRGPSGQWILEEEKFVLGAYEDGNGLGLGVFSVGDRCFTSNGGLWERTSTGWRRLLSFLNFGGDVPAAADNLWIVESPHSLWHWNGADWRTIELSVAQTYPTSFLYGRGWSDGNQIFMIMHSAGKTFIVHGQ